MMRIYVYAFQIFANTHFERINLKIGTSCAPDHQHILEKLAGRKCTCIHLHFSLSRYARPHLLSKLRLSLNFSMMGSVPPLKRPPAPNSPPRGPVGAASSDAIVFV